MPMHATSASHWLRRRPARRSRRSSGSSATKSRSWAYRPPAERQAVAGQARDAGTALEPVVAAILAEQVRVLAAVGDASIDAGRLEACAQSAANALLSAGRSDDAERCRRALVKGADVFRGVIEDLLAGRPKAPSPTSAEDASEPVGADASRTLRVDAGRVDALVTLVGELVVARNALRDLAARAEAGEDAGTLARAIRGGRREHRPPLDEPASRCGLAPAHAAVPGVPPVRASRPRGGARPGQGGRPAGRGRGHGSGQGPRREPVRAATARRAQRARSRAGRRADAATGRQAGNRAHPHRSRAGRGRHRRVGVRRRARDRPSLHPPSGGRAWPALGRGRRCLG